MNFVLVENRYIIDGPKPWNFRAFQNILKADLDIDATLPPNNEEYLQITDTVAFYPSTIIEPENFNSKIHQYAGPFWTFTDTTATGTYTIMDGNIDHVKSNLKNIIATERYKAEISGTKIEIQGNTVTVDTTREGRNIFVHQFVLMDDDDSILWKFPECWLTLTKLELGAALVAGTAHVRSAFDWESVKSAEIDNCTTLAELDAVILKHE